MSAIFVETAPEIGETDLSWLEKDYESIVAIGFSKVDRYTVTDKTEDAVSDMLQEYDVICVAGGNAFYLLQQFQKVNALQIIQDLVQKKGKIYLGSSSGAIICAPDISPVEVILPRHLAPELKDTIGLNLVDFLVMPHWGDPDPYWKRKYISMAALKMYREDIQTIPLTNDQYIVVRDDGFFRIMNT